LRPYQAATAAVFILIAAVAMFDTRSGALPDATGGAPGGLRGGWYPFWSAAVVAAAGAYVAFRALTTAQAVEGAFKGWQGVVDLARFVLPMFVTAYLMAGGRLGFYVAGGAYIAYYAAFVARYRPHWAVLAGAAIPTVIYLMFELGFKATFPKSFLYPGLPF
jgi:hypothetical protein